jgi:hypothetical protein
LNVLGLYIGSPAKLLLFFDQLSCHVVFAIRTDMAKRTTRQIFDLLHLITPAADLEQNSTAPPPPKALRRMSCIEGSDFRPSSTVIF